ncbi:formylglycine-generating enzyme family protein [Ectopseudomonas khazarica]|uniref:Formylglycine-generating enzyme, required for sulfatase activity, contains SUMF1/FGE domain n=1 Tax=Ectopseudomonas oleovorans TaxID=301 RepID=A0A653B283_ECTOL|nr:Formylglycine-generating enzyme, required for sulfatase activity, contains SUMF1/FGE domain [Pseudomonas oleovorans]
MQVLIARAVTRQLSLGLAGLALLALPAVASESISDALASGGTGPELVVIPAGQFQLGDGSGRGNDNERPPRTVTFAAPFAIGRYEVTFADWQRYAEAANLPMPDNEGWGLSARRPVIHVSWRDAHAYTQWLSRQSGARYRLPTEAEWEYAARGGSPSYYWWGDDLDSSEQAPRAHCRGCATSRLLRNKTAAVGQFPANGFGLSDTAGNVWEWTASRFTQRFDGSETQSASLLDDSPRVVRGGAWNSGPSYLRSSMRDLKQPHHRDYALGFRVLRELP